MPTKFKFKPDRHSQFVAQAMLLRAEYEHRIALDRATTEDVLVSPDTRVPSDGELSTMYEELMSEGSEEEPETPHGALLYIELVSDIVAGELMSRYRPEGGIVTTERDLGYALELLNGVHGWVNRLDWQDAVEQERAFHREHPERRGRRLDALLSEAINPELRSRAEALATEYAAPLPDGDAGLVEALRRIREYEPRRKDLYREFDISPAIEEQVIEPTLNVAENQLREHLEQTPPNSLVGAAAKLRYLADPQMGLLTNRSEVVADQVLEIVEREAGRGPGEWPALHARWAEIAGRIMALELEESERRSKVAVARLRAERERLIKEDLDQVLQQIYALPVDSWEAVATLLDIAIEEGDIEPPMDLASDWPTFKKVLKALRQRLAPAIEFTALRRALAASVDVEATIASA